MFSNHEMVRQAATEAMSNLAAHPDMIQHLGEAEKVKVWIVFAADFQENLDSARAAIGSLATTTQDGNIANVFVSCSSQSNLSKTMVKSVFVYGNWQLMHRVLVLTLHVVEHGDKIIW